MNPFELIAEPVQREEPTGPFWACGDCGNTAVFKQIVDDTPNGIEYDCQCLDCGSLNTGETTEVLRNLADRIDTLRGDLSSLQERVDEVLSVWEGHHKTQEMWNDLKAALCPD